MNKTVVFDLDDTLIYEIEYLKSAFLEISKSIGGKHYSELFNQMISLYYSKLDVFQFVCEIYPVYSKDKLIELYRNHNPKIKLIKGALDTLSKLSENNFQIGLVSDGYSVTQRNKLKATSIEFFFDDIIISEEFGSTKSNPENFSFYHKNNSKVYFYVGDNPIKDFYNPNRLGWKTICLMDKGYNIHKQDFNLEKEYLPDFTINNLTEIIDITS